VMRVFDTISAFVFAGIMYAISGHSISTLPAKTKAEIVSNTLITAAAIINHRLSPGKITAKTQPFLDCGAEIEARLPPKWLPVAGANDIGSNSKIVDRWFTSTPYTAADAGQTTRVSCQKRIH